MWQLCGISLIKNFILQDPPNFIKTRVVICLINLLNVWGMGVKLIVAYINFRLPKILHHRFALLLHVLSVMRGAEALLRDSSRECAVSTLLWLWILQQIQSRCGPSANCRRLFKGLCLHLVGATGCGGGQAQEFCDPRFEHRREVQVWW